MISVAVYSAHGNPADVLRIETQPWPRPGPDEVVVAMRFEEARDRSARNVVVDAMRHQRPEIGSPLPKVVIDVDDGHVPPGRGQ